jgi:DNA-binding Xre family transcriptional regulator
MHTGNCIKKAHEKTGILRKTVADAIGMSHANYSHLLSRQNVLVSTFRNVCEQLGMTMDEVAKLG